MKFCMTDGIETEFFRLSIETLIPDEISVSLRITTKPITRNGYLIRRSNQSLHYGIRILKNGFVLYRFSDYKCRLQI